MSNAPVFAGEYAQMLSDYCTTRSEASLYHASLLGQRFVESDVGPDDIIASHAEALETSLAQMPVRQKAAAAVDALQFLLEVMIAYGVHHKRYLELRLGESARLAEAEASLERQRAAQAEQADLEKSQFLDAIVHELRTPLTAANGFVQLALRKAEREGTQSQELLLEARQALERLSRLCGELASASRGHLPDLQLVPQELGALVRQACIWAGPAAFEKGITLTNKCACTELNVSGDTDALLSILGNLLSNAIRYTPKAGKVTVECDSEGGSVRLSVTDNGVGMTAAVTERIFEKFYRGPEGRVLEAGGFGLGLALVRQLVDMHGGEIRVESTPGVGSTFRVLLPRLVTTA